MSARIKKIKVSTPYKEESVKVPAVVTVFLLILMSIPLVLWILRINGDGTRSANVTRYETLIEKVDTDVRTVKALLSNDEDELAKIRAQRNSQVVTLIVPEVVIVDQQKAATSASPLNVELDGIYWSVNNPLVSIGDETYRMGDIIQGYEIVRIDKTTVQFQSADGTIVTKDMYGDLLEGSKR